jgi:predicted AAA+ superfamily ATPase
MKYLPELIRFFFQVMKFATNGAILTSIKNHFFYVDPIEEEVTKNIIQKIKEGVWMFFYGPRACGKTTRIERVLETLENDYCCIRYAFS